MTTQQTQTIPLVPLIHLAFICQAADTNLLEKDCIEKIFAYDFDKLKEEQQIDVQQIADEFFPNIDYAHSLKLALDSDATAIHIDTDSCGTYSLNSTHDLHSNALYDTLEQADNMVFMWDKCDTSAEVITLALAVYAQAEA